MDNRLPAAETPVLPDGSASHFSLRARLLLLVAACIVPLVCLGIVRETVNFQAQRDRVYDGLLTIARGTAIAVERDLLLRISALETLAMSPALQAGDLDQFSAQAEAFLTRQPEGSALGIITPDLQLQRLWGAKLAPGQTLPKRDASEAATRVFSLGRPAVVDLHVGRLSHTPVFTVDVPVFRDGRVAYDLFARITSSVMRDLAARQNVPPDGVLSIIDAAGSVVARVPHAERYIGAHIVPELWDAVRSGYEGIAHAPTLEGVGAVAAFTHVGDLGWAVAAGAAEDAILAPLLAAITRVVEVGALVLLAGLLAALVAARGITRPIERLRWIAEQQDPAVSAIATAGGLPETAMVARALVRAAEDRRAVSSALAESEARFRALFERSPSGTILLDPETVRVIDCNEAAAAFVGCSVDEFRGSPITRFTDRTTPQRVREICDQVAAGQSIRYETRIRGLHGPRDLVIAVAPVQVAGRTLLLLTQIDITDLREAQADLRVNQERLELARQGADLGIWDWDLENGTLVWSEHQWRLHGLEPRQAAGPTPAEWAATIDPADLARAQAELRAALKTPGHQYATEYSVILPDGSLRRMLGRGQALRGPDGRVSRMVGINMDVTARYEAEMARDRLIAALETERGRMADIIEALPIGVGIVGASGRVILGNAIMRHLSGPVIPSHDPARNDAWIGYRPDGSRILPADFPGGRALRGETVLPGQEFLFRESDGTETWIRAGATPLRWDNGQVQEVLVILLDIDAEKRLMAVQQEVNARLEQRVRDEMAAREAAQQRAAHAERMHALGQIAGGIAHDFNNVLQAVSGGAALIERRPNDADRVLRNARMVLDAAKRGAAITSRLLAFARRGDLRAEPIDARALLVDMAEVLTHTLGGSVVCKVDAPPDLPPLLADRGQLETVLVNLATNARDAMPSGGTLTLAARAESVESNMLHPTGLAAGAYVRIVASDTGVGMERSVLARVTEPFFTTKEPGKGTGLGLAMAKGFAEQSGGSLSIESVEGQGTSISLWLPRANAETAEAAPLKSAPRVSDAGRTRVLLVDDDAIVRQVLALSLEDSGYAVLAADSGAAALALLGGNERPDVIVSDLTMPGMDGLELIRTVQERRPGLPAVLLTGYAGDGAALAVGGAISGAFSLLRKPVSGTQLVDRITALLASRRSSERV